MSMCAKTCGINEALLNVEMTVAMDLSKKILAEDLSKRDFQVVLNWLLPSLDFQNLWQCIYIALTIPVGYAACHRSLSGLKLSKTHLRNKTEDDCLSDLAMLFVHKHRTWFLDCDMLLDEFANAKDDVSNYCRMLHELWLSLIIHYFKLCSMQYNSFKWINWRIHNAWWLV